MTLHLNLPRSQPTVRTCTGETDKKAVKLTFAKGASLVDQAGLFNASLDGKVRRAIDSAEDGAADETALATLNCSAVALNRSFTGSGPKHAA